MYKEVEKPKDGYEPVVKAFDSVISTIEETQNAEIEQIKAKYAERLNNYIADRKNYVVVETIEVPDEATENADITQEPQTEISF